MLAHDEHMLAHDEQMLAHDERMLANAFKLNIFFNLIYLMADSNDITQQVTSKTPTTRVKDPKKVAAGQALQRKNREAREAQKKIQEAKEKELFEAKAKIEELESAKAQTADTPPPKNVLTTTQWLSAISIVVSLAGIYYKREEIKGLLTRPQVPPPAPPNTPVDVAPRKGINLMD